MVRRLTRIILTLIQDTTPAWVSRGARQDLRWVPGPAVPGVIATGGTAMSISTTTIILTGTTLTTSTAVREGEGKGAIVGSITRVIAEMRPTTGAVRTN